MEPGVHVMVKARWPSTEEIHCRILDIPENRELAPCNCGAPDCREFRLLEQVEQPGIQRYVGQCRITPLKNRSKVAALRLPKMH